MSDSNIVEFTGKVPAALADALAGDNDDLSAGIRGGYGVISIRGSRWHIKHEGEETTVTGKDGDPVGSLRVVMLKSNPNVSKIYYSGGYEEGSDAPPDCFSVDGKTPDPGAEGTPLVEGQKVSSCAACPMNEWGSRVTDAGKKIKACSDSRRIAVVPEGDLANEVYGGPMLLRVPAASLADLAKYGKAMKQKGFPYNTVLTRLHFDMEAAYPKIKFSPLRPLNDDEANQLVELLGDPKFTEQIETVLAKDLEIVKPAAEAAPQLPEFEEAPEVEAKKSTPKKETKKEEPVAEAAPVAESDDSDDALDGDLEDVLAGLENL